MTKKNKNIAFNSDQVKDFWDKRALKVKNSRIEGLSNLEEDSNLLELKINSEAKKVMEWIQPISKKSKILDLGSGTGQWSFRFSKLVNEITAVEYSEGMYDIAVKESKLRDISNIKFVCQSAQKFLSSQKYRLIWISGLLIYMTDSECESLLSNCQIMTDQKSVILLRDATGVLNRHEIRNKYSEDLDDYYSATYRTATGYRNIFKKFGFSLIRDEDMFPENSPLNKWKETRLRLYKFKKL